jgi:DNA primase
MVESCGNALKLIQNGFDQTVCIFGTKLYPKQVLDLELKNVKKILVCLDNDEAGQKQKFDQFSQFDFKYITTTGYNDVGEMPDLKIKELFHDYWNLW